MEEQTQATHKHTQKTDKIVSRGLLILPYYCKLANKSHGQVVATIRGRLLFKMGYKVISCRRGRQTMWLLFEGGFYSRAAFIQGRLLLASLRYTIRSLTSGMLAHQRVWHEAKRYPTETDRQTDRYFYCQRHSTCEQCI